MYTLYLQIIKKKKFKRINLNDMVNVWRSGLRCYLIFRFCLKQGHYVKLLDTFACALHIPIKVCLIKLPHTTSWVNRNLTESRESERNRDPTALFALGPPRMLIQSCQFVWKEFSGLNFKEIYNRFLYMKQWILMPIKNVSIRNHICRHIYNQAHCLFILQHALKIRSGKWDHRGDGYTLLTHSSSCCKDKYLW